MKLIELVERYLDKQLLHKASDISVRTDLPSMLDNRSEAWREAFEKRAGIMEFDGGLPHAKAKKTAEECLRTSFCGNKKEEQGA